MSWVYKMKNKVAKKDAETGEMVAICPKCHYILLLRDGERPIFCPMCGNENAAAKKKENK